MEDQGSGGLSGSKDTKEADIWECSDCMCDCLPHVFRPVEAGRGWLDLLRLESQTPTMWVWEPNPRALQEQQALFTAAPSCQPYEFVSFHFLLRHDRTVPLMNSPKLWLPE